MKPREEKLAHAYIAEYNHWQPWHAALFLQSSEESYIIGFQQLIDARVILAMSQNSGYCSCMHMHVDLNLQIATIASYELYILAHELEVSIELTIDTFGVI